MYVLVTYVPDGYQEQVKNALFAQGAGALGAYDSCSWQVLGEGQFRPMKGANPFIGKEDCLERVKEWRIEMLVEDGKADAVIRALREAHPYEEPAFHLIPVRINCQGGF
jgi:Uncharacterized protein conserved in bacteria